MSISYDIQKCKSYITKDNVTVETITTSQHIPGQIDLNYLPFSGITFASKINLTQYKQNVSNSLLTQLLYSLYTLDKSVLSSYFENPTYITECSVAKLQKQLNGNYYVVINSNLTEEVLLPRIRASTNFGNLDDNVTSLFRVESEEVVTLTDGDILIIYSSYVPNGDSYDIIFGFQNINFRLPISSVSNNNITNNTITNAKIKDKTITENKLADSSISLRTLSSDIVNLLNRSSNNGEVSTIICLCNDLENKVNKIEKFINIFSQTYFIKDTISDSLITLENIDDIEL
jgi:hypothetical protein